jgi:hypothetical protein
VKWVVKISEELQLEEQLVTVAVPEHSPVYLIGEQVQVQAQAQVWSVVFEHPYLVKQLGAYYYVKLTCSLVQVAPVWMGVIGVQVVLVGVVQAVSGCA